MIRVNSNSSDNSSDKLELFLERGYYNDASISLYFAIDKGTSLFASVAHNAIVEFPRVSEPKALQYRTRP